MEEDLKNSFAVMTDDEMIRLGAQYTSLTDEAQALVRDEFKRRGLELPMRNRTKSRMRCSE